MLTKEECEKALETIGDWPLWDSERTESGMWKVKDASCDEYKVIEKLINEHFDNPPLSFGDLKEGMWVWDDEEKWYMKIVFLFVPCKQYHFKGSFKVWADSCERSLDFVVFEENRFYRRQKE